MYSVDEELVSSLFSTLEREGSQYALLRNYEAFPQFRHDVDLVMDSRDIARWREIATAAADREGWNILTECDHFALSPVREHNIESFRFYRFSPRACLQVDLFHGFPLWGLPLFTERALLDGSERAADGRFTRINPVTENLWRMFQIERLAVEVGNREKVERYRDRVLQFCRTREDSLRRALYEAVGQAGLRALKHLQNGDLSGFGKAMRWGKLRFVLRHAARRPFRTVKTLVARLMDKSRITRTRQCGFVLRVYAPDTGQHKRLFDTLDALVQSNVIQEWTADAAWDTQARGFEHGVMLRCGLVIKWENSTENAVLDLGSIASNDDLATRIMEHLIDRHQILYRREAAV